MNIYFNMNSTSETRIFAIFANMYLRLSSISAQNWGNFQAPDH